MSHPIKVTFTDTEYPIVAAYAADRGLPLASLTKSLVLSDVKRHLGRSGLLTALEGMVKEITQTAVENALAGRHPRGEGELPRPERFVSEVQPADTPLFTIHDHPYKVRGWMGGEKEIT